MSEDVLKYVPDKAYRTENTGHRFQSDTRIMVRALTPEDKPVSCDISELDRDSLIRWLRSRGGKNAWAESVVLMMLGHPALGEKE